MRETLKVAVASVCVYLKIQLWLLILETSKNYAQVTQTGEEDVLRETIKVAVASARVDLKIQLWLLILDTSKNYAQVTQTGEGGV